jgi:hypothetical protein
MSDSDEEVEMKVAAVSAEPEEDSTLANSDVVTK